MPTKHTVASGEDMTTLAAANGFASWHAIADDAANAGLRGTRPNPNLLSPGDVVTIPDRKQTPVDVPTGSTRAFTIKRPKAELRVHLRDLVGQKLGGVAYQLTVGRKVTAGTADGDGVVKVAIPPDQATATLEVQLPEPPPPPAAPADGLTVAKENFAVPKEADDPAKAYTRPKKLVWKLTLGALGPADDLAGAQRRLQNLGFPCAPSGALDAATKAALSAFQEARKLTVSGALDAATKAELVKAHDQGAP